MVKVEVICVGKLKERYFKDACSEYIKRLLPYCKLSIVEVDEYKTNSNPSKSEIDITKRMEGKKIISKISSNSFVISLCIEGNMIDSEELSKKIEILSVSGVSCITFIIGGSFGLSDDVKNISNFKLSISKMTFPHQLARVILLEQIYRAFQISNSGKYHK